MNESRFLTLLTPARGRLWIRRVWNFSAKFGRIRRKIRSLHSRHPLPKDHGNYVREG